MLFPAGKSFFEAQSFDVFVEKVFQAEHRVQTIEGEPQRLPLAGTKVGTSRSARANTSRGIP